MEWKIPPAMRGDLEGQWEHWCSLYQDQDILVLVEGFGWFHTWRQHAEVLALLGVDVEQVSGHHVMIDPEGIEDVVGDCLAAGYRVAVVEVRNG